MSDRPVIDLDTLCQAFERMHERHGAGLGFERASTIAGNTFRDQSTVVIMPLRGRQVDFQVAAQLYGMIAPMNQSRHIQFCWGDEVGIAYDRMIRAIIDHPVLGKWKYIMTVEGDNLVPPDAHKRLLETIEAGLYDGVSGLYFTKGDVNMPMAYGDPARFEQTGVLEFTPRDVADAIAAGRVMPVNGIAMGCALWRMEMFRDVPQPWYVTVDDVVGGRPQGFTQDLYFCKEARRRGRRFAVDCSVKVGHMDLATGTVY